MDEANQRDCPRCREIRSTSELNGAKRLCLYRTAARVGLLLLLMMIATAMLGFIGMRANDKPLLSQTFSNVFGHLGFSRPEIDTLDKDSDMQNNRAAVQSRGTDVQPTEQLRHRRKRQVNSEDADTSPRNDTDADDSRSIHSESQPATDVDAAAAGLSDLKERISRATSLADIQDIIASSLPKTTPPSRASLPVATQASPCRRRRPHRCRCCRRPSPKSSSDGAKPSSTGSSSTNTELERRMLNDVRRKSTCSQTEAEIVGEFGLGRNHGRRIPFNFCGPSYSTVLEKTLHEAALEHTKWMKEIEANGLCRPMEMIVNLEPEQNLLDSPEFFPFTPLIYVRKCRLLYVNKDDTSENVTCVAVKKRSRLVPIEHGDVVKTYIVTDHLECNATTNRSSVVLKKVEATATTNRSSIVLKKVEATAYTPTIGKRSCPWPFEKVNQTLWPFEKVNQTLWPFEKVNQTRCTCTEAKKGSRGFLHYLMCKNVQEGIWSLQTQQKRCVRERRCFKPVCATETFITRLGRCPRQPRRKTNVKGRSNKQKPNT